MPEIEWATVAVLLSCFSVIALVLSDLRKFRPGRYLFKPLAAASFVWLACILGATESSYGAWLLAGLVACMAGDLLLMPETERTFLAGLAAFLCGHLLFAVAFLQLPLSYQGIGVSTVPALLVLALASSWLMPHVDHTMKFAVRIYTLVITGMLITAGSTVGQAGATLIVVGAWGFALSDLAVARQRFVRSSPCNGLWGTPLYFLSQMLLATSVGQL